MNRAAVHLPDAGGLDRITQQEAEEFRAVALSMLASLPVDDPGLETEDIRRVNYLTMRQAYQLLRTLRKQQLVKVEKVQVRHAPPRRALPTGTYHLFDPQRPDTKICLWTLQDEE